VDPEGKGSTQFVFGRIGSVHIGLEDFDSLQAVGQIMQISLRQIAIG
jgi:hypothetical protein